MALKITGLKLPLTADESSLPERAARALRIRTDDIVGLRLVRTSLDARKKQDIYYACTVEVQLHTPLEKRILGKALPGVEAAQPREPVCWPIGEKAWMLPSQWWGWDQEGYLQPMPWPAKVTLPW